VCIRYHSNDSTEPLSSNDKGIFTGPLPSKHKGIFAKPLPSNDTGIFTEPLPSYNRGIFTEPLGSNDNWTFTEPLPSNNRGAIHDRQTHTHTGQQRDLISLLLFSQNRESRLKMNSYLTGNMLNLHQNNGQLVNTL
jgi:hypothetical protein